MDKIIIHGPAQTRMRYSKLERLIRRWYICWDCQLRQDAHVYLAVIRQWSTRSTWGRAMQIGVDGGIMAIRDVGDIRDYNKPNSFYMRKERWVVA
jgi:hypothetical protein